MADAGGSRNGGRTSGAAAGKGGTGGGGGMGRTGGTRDSTGASGSRPFISYVATHPDEVDSDPDGLDQATRMAVESQAIDKIIALEPSLQRTADGNLGFDLYEADASGKTIRWVEVKSMTSSLADRSVGLSRAQFDCAREHGASYWLYVVEHATDADRARILRIHNPVAHARTFTFDRGWVEIARSDPPV